MIYLFIFVLSSGKQNFYLVHETIMKFFFRRVVDSKTDGWILFADRVVSPPFDNYPIPWIYWPRLLSFLLDRPRKIFPHALPAFLISSKFLPFLSFFPSFSQVSQKWNWYIDSGEKWMVRMEEPGPRSLFTLVYRPVLSGSHFRTR